MAGLDSKGARYDRGRKWLTMTSLGTSALVLAILLTVQFRDEPTLVRSSESRRATAEIHEAVDSTGIAHLVEANVRFTRADIEGQSSLLCVIYVQPIGSEYDEDEVRSAVERSILARLDRPDVTPLLSVQVVSPGSR